VKKPDGQMPEKKQFVLQRRDNNMQRILWYQLAKIVERLTVLGGGVAQ
jgi:hypothetical protein